MDKTKQESKRQDLARAYFDYVRIWYRRLVPI